MTGLLRRLPVRKAQLTFSFLWKRTKCPSLDLLLFFLMAERLRILNLRLDHICLDVAPQINPLRVSNYQEEDHVGKMKGLAIVCHPEKLGRAVLERWCWHLCVHWLRE